ncbi:mRNA interferase RelE/StbE [Sphaerotilus mobilis]|uniref:mRNA interferase RelE/StbE n=2 Tax=Sphaerotilus mobilis TaxID=47994 RepID=A0A4Q7LUI0_9BURK|nr:mRNA interferase RelE/StbE [Sphaerotilus mobilis]
MTTFEGKPTHTYKLRFMPEALDEWHKLDGSIKANLKKLLVKRLDHPHVPGGELHGPLAGCYKIKLRQQGVRLVYSVEDDHLLVTVIAVDRREDGVVYESALSRLSKAAATLSQVLRDKLK